MLKNNHDTGRLPSHIHTHHYDDGKRGRRRPETIEIRKKNVFIYFNELKYYNNLFY